MFPFGLMKRWRNPRNETRIFLARQIRRHGFSVGAHSYGHPKVRFADQGHTLVIGRFCSIADKVEILLGGGHHMHWTSTFPFSAFPDAWPGSERLADYRAGGGNVVIGSDVWIGSGAMILPGVTIGHGAVIAARAVVTRDVAPYTLMAGVPARAVRTRFPDDLVADLLEAAWWELPDAALVPLLPLLQGERARELVAAVRLLRAGAAPPSAGP
ncbi:CatB-related O-acetyltransferase [Pseudochelatococcus sp. B33]